MKISCLTVLICITLCSCAMNTASESVNKQRYADIENDYNTGQISYDEYERQKWEVDNPDPTDIGTLGEMIWNSGEE